MYIYSNVKRTGDYQVEFCYLYDKTATLKKGGYGSYSRDFKLEQFRKDFAEKDDIQPNLNITLTNSTIGLRGFLVKFHPY